MKTALPFSFCLFLSLSILYVSDTATANNCEIGIIEMEVLPCGDGGFFKVEIDFDHANVGEEGFRVLGNGNEYGNFNYEDLPIIISGLAGDGVTEYEFVVIDNQFEECTNWGSIDPVDCGVGDCYISELNIDDHPCEEGQYNVYLNFEYENTGSSFLLFIDEELYGDFNYESLPLNIGPFVGDGETSYHFLVRDVQYEGCAADRTFGPVSCEEVECNIRDVVATVLPCNEESEFNVLINFIYENTGESGFTLRGNGNNYGSYEYAALPIELGPFVANGETNYEFEARDKQFEACYGWTGVEAFECDTAVQIDNLDLDIVDCDGNTYFLVVDFNYANVGEDGFIMSGKDLEPVIYNYEELPVTVGPLNNDQATSYFFTIRDGEQVRFGNWERFLPFNCDNIGIFERQLTDDIVQVFPNPASRFVQFSNHHSETVELVVYNQSGQKLQHLSSIQPSETIRMEFNQAGMYYFHAVSKSKFEKGKVCIVR